MKYRFLQENITAERIIEANAENSILLENSKGQVGKILDFLTSTNSVLLATGFLGTGKTSVVKNCLNALSEETVLLWANCYESTNLDDIFLEFFEEFKNLTAQGKIKVPQAKFENFSQRINAYFYSISKPIVIVLNSFQALLPENAQHILDFIAHLSEFAKIKTIIISRNSIQDKLTPSIKFDKINFKALDKELFQKYLTAHKIRIHGPVFEEFYKLTKGYYFYTTLALKIMAAKKMSPLDLMTAQVNSFLSLKEYLFREFLSMVDSVGGHLLRFLTVIRYPVNIRLLQSLNLYDEARIQMYAANSLIEIEHGNIYLKDYYKDITEGEIPDNVLVKLHRSCVELYEMQLPRKPEERDLLISRKTIRQEIEYHKIFLPKKVELSKNIEIFNAQAILPQPESRKEEEKPQLPPPPKPQPKELKDLLFVFDEAEENLLITDIANSLNDFMLQAQAQEDAENEMGAAELLNLINEAEKAYDFKHIITLGEKLLLKTDNKELQALANNKIAHAYTGLTDAYNAQKHFTTAKNLYTELNNTAQALENEFYIAKMNYLMFKRAQAKEILLQLDKQADKSLQIKSSLLLFDIFMEEGDEEDAFETCKTAMKLINKSENPKTICELLFKCGLILEARGNTYRAIEAYEKALKFNENIEINHFLPQIYSNLTTLYAETDNLALAGEYAQKTLTTASTPEELYTANIKLAQLKPENAEQHYETALKYAKELQDNFYRTSALMAYGDFLYGKTRILEALEKYFTAHKFAKNNLIKENMTNIERRILDVKYRVTEEIFNRKAKEFNYEQ
ncbi:MAG: hypothetical protein NC390_03480 [Fusobacterium sp.]|nr:hypothetical protein [Fusobacterium sp.]